MFTTDDLDGLRRALADVAMIDGPEGSRLAAVLVPLIRNGDEWSLVFTRRSEELSNHSGEISFPGGRVDEGEDPRAAALREAHEEIGIEPAHVETLGRLPRVFTFVSSFMIEPWIGVIPRSEFIPNPKEVAEVLEVPIEHLLSADSRREQKFIRGGSIYTNFAYDIDSHVIWGATARILTDLLDVIGRVRSN